MYRFVGRSVFVALLFALAVSSAFAQKSSLTCREDGNWSDEKLVSKCEIREQSLAPTGSVISIDGRQNGGVSVKGWYNNQILVRARIHSSAPTDAEAASLGSQIRIETGGAKIYASGPDTRKNYQWDVSYEVFVPRRADITAETNNGGISIADVTGRIDFTALNGGVVLRKVGGTVRGTTTNGGLVVELGGDHWEGETLDVRTTNGGVIMSVPENYSAHLETGTVNGSLSVDFPVTVQGRITKEIALNLGSGGATVKAVTTNGGVKIRRVQND
jgi:hypothetical protein